MEPRNLPRLVFLITRDRKRTSAPCACGIESTLDFGQQDFAVRARDFNFLHLAILQLGDLCDLECLCHAAGRSSGNVAGNELETIERASDKASNSS